MMVVDNRFYMIIIMYLVRKLRFEFVFEITILLGAILNILGFLLVDLYLGFSLNTGEIILGTIVSTLIVFVAQFFRMVLDYTAVEHVQFEDDDYYYYVKAVPKIDMALPQKNVTTFTDNWEEASEMTATQEEEEEFEFEREETGQEEPVEEEEVFEFEQEETERDEETEEME